MPLRFCIENRHLLFVVLAPFAVACGSEVSVQPPTSASSGQGGEYTFIAGSGGDGGTGITPPTPPQPPRPPDVDDPGCTEHPPALEAYTCDPFKPSGNGCMPDESCQIYVEYPSTPCGQEVYGSTCLAAGPGKQGDGCEGGFDCSSGFVCVITGSGTQCVQLCKVNGPSGCTPGFVCEPIDVKGFGGCL